MCDREGHSLYVRNQHEQALTALDYVRDEAGDSAAYHLDRGLVLYALERFDEAIAEFDAVLEKYPISIRAGTQRAFALARLGRLEEAQEQFEYMLRWRSALREYRRIKTTSYLRGNIGVLELRRGDLEAGRKDLEAALEIDGSNDFAGMVLYKILPQMEAGHLSPESFSHLTAAFESLDLHREVAATRHLQALVAGSPTYVPAYLVLAKGLRESSKYADCEALLEDAEQKVPGDLTLRIERLRCTILRYGASSVGARPAIAEVKKILEEHPTNELARKLLAALDER
ncbi:MAG: tetratricopeptide repeat protein [Myxococcota bacterium]